jgi:diguanylate cyclase (GGDEF)-like protein
VSGKLHILCCHNFQPEVEAVIAAEAWPDVSVAAFPSRCGRPPLSWDELRALLGEGCTQVIIFGHACLKELGSPPVDWPPVRQIQQDNCLDLLAGTALVSDAIARGAYLLTPVWLDDWRGNLREMGFDESNAAGFFHDFACELLLLDTGVVADAPRKLAELADALEMPFTRVTIGLDYIRQSLARLVVEWRLTEGQQHAREQERNFARELADHQSAMDFLGRLPLLKDERETIAAIQELFDMLFAPRDFHYVRVENGIAQCGDRLPTDLARQVRDLRSNWAWMDSQTGLLLRISRAGETLGVVVADQFACPEYRDRYLNLAISVAGVSGLAIDNARTYRRIKETEEALRKSERSLKMAQAMARIGHWEMDLDTGEVLWSDETFRILGYQPDTFTASQDRFFQVIHADDRAGVANHIKAVRDGGRFDTEFRIVLPGGGISVLHGIGEVLLPEGDERSPAIAAIQGATGLKHAQLLGVIQDITHQKELEWKLEHEAHTDPLTGCANRRYFLELAEHELARARRHAQEVSVLMLDLDHFKAVNDQYGHQVGDQVLRKFVEVGTLALRAEDVIGRLGGEEFAVLLPETGSKEALEVAERLCRAVAETQVPLDGGVWLHFTTSIGVASWVPEEFSIGTMLGRADRALYEAKSTGRNRVVVA